MQAAVWAGLTKACNGYGKYVHFCPTPPKRCIPFDYLFYLPDSHMMLTFRHML